MKRVLVTGATGMIGSALSRRLVDDGFPVVALVMDPDPSSELYRSGTADAVSVVHGRVEELHTLERAIAAHGVDTVFHLAAQTLVGVARRLPLLTFESNVLGTWNVLEACRRHADAVGSIVVASSDKAYGTVEELPYREDLPLGGDEPYAASKACADLVAQAYGTTYDLPVRIARCGNVYGPGDLNWSRIVPGTIRSLLLGEQPLLRSDGSYVRDYLHVDDVVDSYLAMARGACVPGEAFNLSDESPLSVIQIYDAVCEAAGRAGTEPKILDDAPGEIHDQWLSAAKAREQLGWTPKVRLRNGLSSTVAWYRALLGVS
ncbi:MAG TPA: NAD-dependent epimerase/dehydratase family protein [Acidimicrobiia bacterium]